MARLRKRRLRAHGRPVSDGAPVTRLRGWLLFAALPACQFGGPSADPSQYVSVPDAADDGSVAPPGDDATVATPDGSPALPVADGSVGDDGLEGGSTPGEVGADSGECAQTVAACDPIH